MFTEKILLAGSLGMAGFGYVNQWSIPYVGVPFTVVSMAAAGALLSNTYSDRKKDKKKVAMYAVTNTILASVFVAVAPPMMDWDWVVPGLQAPFAFIAAFGAQYALPSFISMVPEIIRKIFKLPPKEEKNDN